MDPLNWQREMLFDSERGRTGKKERKVLTETRRGENGESKEAQRERKILKEEKEDKDKGEERC